MPLIPKSPDINPAFTISAFTWKTTKRSRSESRRSIQKALRKNARQHLPKDADLTPMETFSISPPSAGAAHGAWICSSPQPASAGGSRVKSSRVQVGKRKKVPPRPRNRGRGKGEGTTYLQSLI